MIEPGKPILSPETLDMLRSASEEGADHACEALQAAIGANDGRTEPAAAIFRAIVSGSADHRLLFAGFQFYFRTGELDLAARACERRIELASQHHDPARLARARTNLGLVHLTAGRHSEALRSCTAAVEIDEAIGDEFALARDLGNLANVHEALGELDTAERLNLQALGIAERIGAAELAAGRLANLGDIALARGDRGGARARWRGAIELFNSLDQPWTLRELGDKLRGLDHQA